MRHEIFTYKAQCSQERVLGSQRIIDAVLKDDQRTLYFITNGGMNTLAQALFDYRANHSKEQMDAFLRKIRVRNEFAEQKLS